jgi:phospholipid/cholesterol/gamma-HCH transport system substrate-binding protein
MQKQAPSVGRILIMVAFALSCFGLLLFLWLAFGGSIPLKPKGYEVKLPFKEATSLANEADVRISGVPVGRVKTVKLARNGLNIATIQLDAKYAPLPADARAILRQKTLLGETYVELTPGSRTAPKLKEGGTLAAAQVSPTVELDEIFRLFDDKTRQGFQVWMQSLAEGVTGRGQDLSDAFGNLAPFAGDTNDLLKILVTQQGAVQRLVRNTGEVFSALSERRGQLRGLITNANTVFQTTADKNQQLADAFTILPTFQIESRKTLNRLDRFARNANPVVSDLRPWARELSPTLISLDRLAPNLKALFRDLNPLITASRAGIPATTQVLEDLRPLLGQLDPFLRQVIPITDFIAPYRSELTAFFANTVGATQATDTPGTAGKKVHYLRTTNPVAPENLAVYPRRPGTNRPNPYTLPGAYKRLASPGFLQVYENRHCGAAGIPLPLSSLGINPTLIPPALNTLIGNSIFNAQGGGVTPAPPCEKQGKFTTNFGGTTEYPRVVAYPPR